MAKDNRESYSREVKELAELFKSSRIPFSVLEKMAKWGGQASQAQHYLQYLQGQFVKPYVESNIPMEGHVINNIILQIHEFKDNNPDKELNIENLMDMMFKSEAPSTFEAPQFYKAMKLISDPIEAVIGKIDMPIIGTLPTSYFNGRCIAVPNSDEYIVVFDSQVFPATNLFGKIIALAIVENYENHSMPDETRAEKRLFEFLDAYLFEGDAHKAPAYFPDEKILMLSGVFRHSMQTFLLAHEYAHILCGHLARDVKTTSTAFCHNRNKVDMVDFSKKNEFQADEKALEISINALTEIKLQTKECYLGFELFFRLQQIIENTISLLLTGREGYFDSHTHPTPEERVIAIRKRLPLLVGRAEADEFIKTGDYICSLLDIMCESVNGSLILKQNEGSKLCDDLFWVAEQVKIQNR